MFKYRNFLLSDYSIKPFAQPPYPAGKTATAVSGEIEAGLPTTQPWEGRAIATHKFRLIEFQAYMETQREENVRSFIIFKYTFKTKRKKLQKKKKYI